MAPEAQKQANRFSQLSANKASFWHLPVLLWRYFIKWVWRGRDEKSRTIEKSEIGRGDQKLKETCFWEFHIPVGMAQRVWAPSIWVLVQSRVAPQAVGPTVKSQMLFKSWVIVKLSVFKAWVSVKSRVPGICPITRVPGSVTVGLVRPTVGLAYVGSIQKLRDLKARPDLESPPVRGPQP